MSARYHQILDHLSGITLWVDFKTKRGKVVDYTVALLVATPAGTETVRLYDGTHGFNEMHRYTRSAGKQSGTRFHSGSLGQGMRAAIQEIKEGFVEMIEGWRRS